ncbi:hypothetical protein VNO80_13341 [Phaseolus coccineus]|uniref:Uncharacterized protein n=1 Tax=Phaseolus coccineus TaxID=3886 RepID=A0AAN9N0T2_PHACN
MSSDRPWPDPRIRPGDLLVEIFFGHFWSDLRIRPSNLLVEKSSDRFCSDLRIRPSNLLVEIYPLIDSLSCSFQYRLRNPLSTIRIISIPNPKTPQIKALVETVIPHILSGMFPEARHL